MGTWCETLDPDFRGCFKLEADERQYIAIIQGDCSQVYGGGRGILADIGEMREWRFSGRVESWGHATLTVTLEGDEGEERTITATRVDSVPSQMILESGGTSRRLLTRESCP